MPPDEFDLKGHKVALGLKGARSIQQAEKGPNISSSLGLL